MQANIPSLTWVLAAALALLPSLASADTPQDLLAGYSRAAAIAQPGFAPSAARGEAFFNQRRTVQADMPNCAACHTADPRSEGRHVITGKLLKPLSPLANAARFTRAAKVEKWFGRNCREVVGRDCSAAEKADLIRFLLSARGA